MREEECSNNLNINRQSVIIFLEKFAETLIYPIF